MKVYDCVELINPYDWMPPYGESKLTIAVNYGAVVLTISYEDPSDGYELKTKDIVFRNVYSFNFSSFPGVSPFDIEPNATTKNRPIGSLVEFTKSDVAQQWIDYCGDPIRKVRHLSMFFLSENKRIDVICETVELIN